ncbi:MAG TPA: hypothetical protein VMU31_09870, partial [Rhizomicrobium sp.]|nr:hypothetical protein [Rhizomicrobium sp.]
MKKSLLEIYALAVCFVSALTVLVGLVSMGDALLGVVAPGMMTTIPFQYQTNDMYWSTTRIQQMDQATKTYPPRPSESTLTKMRLAAIEGQSETTKFTSTQTLLKMGMLVII